MANDLGARDILEKLVAFPTVSSESNLALVDWVEAYLGEHGVTGRRVYDETGTKAALYASVGPDVEGGVVLSGHTDVVPVEGQDWTADPYTLTERDGRLYGRGTSDMKGFVALMLAAVPLARSGALKRPLQLALSYDEEVGCLGAPAMIDDMLRHLPKAGAAVIGEPTGMRVVTGQKGAYRFDVTVRGHEVHSARLPYGVSAIMEGARLISRLNAMNAARAAHPPGPLAEGFDPPVTTFHVGRISGGTANNITAARCTFPIEIRLLPGDDLEAFLSEIRAAAEEIAAAMRERAPETGIDIVDASRVPPLLPETDGAAEALGRRLTGDNAYHAVSYGTEGGQFQDRGYSTVICGPGDIARAHKVDEYLGLDELAAGEDFMRRLVADLAR